MKSSSQGEPGPADRRRHRRFEVKGLRGSLIYALDARILNLSLSGLAVEVVTALPAGKRVVVRLGEGSEGPSLVGTVQWCRLHEVGSQPPRYHCGLSFRDTLTDQGEVLLRYLEKHIVVGDQYLSGRLKAREGEAILLESDFDLVAREISLTGMRIETSAPASQGATMEVEVPLGRATFRSRVRVASVVRSRLASGDVRFEIGLELLDPPRDQVEALEAFLRRQLEPEEAPELPES
jgi:hypothetical protein